MRLLREGLTLAVIDNGHHGASSRVAAGLINPITGHRLNITERFSEFASAAEQEYRRLDALLAPTQPLYVPISQHRLIKNPGQADYLARRLDDPTYADYLSTTAEHYAAPAQMVERGHGIVTVKQTAVVNTNALLDAVARLLKEHTLLYCEKFAYPQLESETDGVHYRDIRARRVIFCEGFQAIYNPWLTTLPFKLAQGDVLTVALQTPTASRECSVPHLANWGNWLLQDAHSATAKLGSSYQWIDPRCRADIAELNAGPQAAAATKLLESARTNLVESLTLVDHSIGIRPTTKYRIPFIGKLSNLPNAYCFNGFGSKGCLLIPYYANQLSNHLLKNQPLDPQLSQWL